jgi:hypothetical protein
MLASHSPAQLGLNPEVVELSIKGSVIVTEVDAEQPFTSVAVKVYVSAIRLLADGSVPPEGAQEYVNGGVPPDTTTVAAPSFSPLQETFVLLKTVATGPDKLSIVTEIVCEH